MKTRLIPLCEHCGEPIPKVQDRVILTGTLRLDVEDIDNMATVPTIPGDGTQEDGTPEVTAWHKRCLVEAMKLPKEGVGRLERLSQQRLDLLPQNQEPREQGETGPLDMIPIPDPGPLDIGSRVTVPAQYCKGDRQGYANKVGEILRFIDYDKKPRLAVVNYPDMPPFPVPQKVLVRVR